MSGPLNYQVDTGGLAVSSRSRIPGIVSVGAGVLRDWHACRCVEPTINLAHGNSDQGKPQNLVQGQHFEYADEVGNSEPASGEGKG